jgi:G protein-coupled receptor GPR1
MSLQIFPPSRSFLGHDGLYRIRYYVLAAWVIIPLGIAAFAFINSGPAFISQGGFCSLPIRPFWYRLALSWIPRYLNWLFVMGVAVRIYRHVGYEFKVFGDESDHSSSAGGIPGMSGGTQRSSRLAMGTMNTQTSHLEPADAAGVEKSAVRDEDVAPDQRGSLVWDLKKPSPPSSARTRDVRRQSVPTFTSVFGGGPAARNDVLTEMETINRHISQSTPNSRRGSKQDASGAQIGVEDFAPLPPLAPPRHYGSSSTINSRKSSTYDSSQPSPLAPIEETKPSIASLSRDNVATRALQLRRKAIQRQLRLLFIYPVVYLILWIMPFVAHALSYSDYYAQNPIYPVSVLNIFCQCIMGLVDVCIFCWREKPWRHVPGSDGTFTGSFKFWRFGQEPNWTAALPRNHPDSTLPSIVPPATDEEEDARQLTSPEGLVGSIKRWSAVRSFSSRTSASHPASRSEDPPSTTSPRKLPPPVIVAPRSHRRTHSDRRVLEAERAQERLALERSEALSQQQFRREAQEARETGAGSEVQGELGGGFVAAQPVSPPKEWWDRHLSTVGSILSEEDGEGRK